jgi:hypothetical protein
MRRNEKRAFALALFLLLLWSPVSGLYRRDSSPALVSRTEARVATVPQRTLEAFRLDFPEVEVTSVEHQVARDGSFLYQFEFTRGGKPAVAVYGVDGTLLPNSL